MSGPIDADAFDASEADGWSVVAGGYDSFFGRVTDTVVEPTLDAAGVCPGQRLLDVASGPGYIAAHAVQRGAAVVGLDVAYEMVRQAHTMHPPTEFLQGDAERLPFVDRSFDAVTGGFVVPHLGRPEQATMEAVRVLVPGGRVALSTWDAPNRSRLVGVFVEAVERAGAAPPMGIPMGPPFFRFSDDAEFARLLQGAGLLDVRIQTVAFTHSVPGPDELWRGFLGGVVRLRAVVLGQDDEMRARIRAIFEELAMEYATDGNLVIPVSVKVASGVKPELA
jgi:SAM-dependent methyltransferase